MCGHLPRSLGSNALNFAHCRTHSSFLFFFFQVLEAYTSERAWRKLREGGFANIQRYFSISNAVAGLSATLKATLGLAATTNDERAATTKAQHSSTPALHVLGSSSTAAAAAIVTPANRVDAAASLTKQQAARREHLAYGACAVDASCTCPAELRANFAKSAFGLGPEEENYGLPAR